ncbi:hypothetical protein G7054_g3806 [Neopestalotiopsis clavispora]|nr:hypothetical protein G7054_g3806 [Neopestalotiopsis clavispora]
MSDNSKLIKFDVCVYKKDEVPEQEFVDWVTKEWPTRATPLIKRHGVVKLAQPSNTREPFRHALKNEMGRPDWTVPDYDLVISYYVPSMDVMQALTTDPEWAELEKMAAVKCNMSVGHFVAGHEIVHFEGNNGGSTS